jgi:hypothetical protein
VEAYVGPILRPTPALDEPFQTKDITRGRPPVAQPTVGQSRTRRCGTCRRAAKDKFHRLKARRGALRAALAVAHKILVSAYHMLAKNLPYRDLGEAYLDQISQTRTVANLKRRLERLGYNVTLEPKAKPA